MSEPGLDVVFVCTGNRFRSPLAAALLRKHLDGSGTQISSAGTLDLGPVPALPEAIEHGRRLGVDLTGHRARYVRAIDLRGADLVVGFEAIHVATAVVDAGAGRDRSFTLRELMSLLDEHVGDPREALARADALRQERSREGLEIVDPLGRGEDVYRAVADELDELVARLATRLFTRT